ncbi:MAG: FecR domain-containing protein [Proteobacteria bacterium]|nr:FecR domain-containing protein [Pseudomonadota bacterium]
MTDRADTGAARAEDEAIAWLVDFENLSEAEQRQFGEWLDERPGNRPAFEKLAREWRQLDVVQQLATGTPDPDPDVVDKWLRRRRWRSRAVPFAAAAGLAGIAMVVAVLSLAPAPPYEAKLQTAVGEFREYVLPDESVVTLNTNSEARIDYSGAARRVHLLSGEAHFDVEPMAEVPFSVVAGSGTVRAVGTAFNVYLRGEVVEVTVTEGVVEVLSGEPAGADSVPAAAPQTLGEGEKLEYGEAPVSVSQVEPREIARQLAWQDGMLDFRGETLAEVIAEAGRYTSTRFTIDDAELETLHVTGYFRAGDVETLLKLIESNEQVAIERAAPDLVRITASP